MNINGFLNPFMQVEQFSLLLQYSRRASKYYLKK